MIFLYLLIPFLLIIAGSAIETFFAKRLIKETLGQSSFIYIDNLYGFYSYTGVRVSLPSTPSGKLEAYLLDDLVVISGKVNMFWLFKTQMKPLILQYPYSKNDTFNPIAQKIEKLDVFEYRIRLDFNYKGVSAVQYTLGLHRNSSEKNKEQLRSWFQEK